MELSERFYARPADLYECFTSLARVQAFSQSPAQVSLPLRLPDSCSSDGDLLQPANLSWLDLGSTLSQAFSQSPAQVTCPGAPTAAALIATSATRKLAAQLRTCLN